jgi:predicted DsbA family dithiol-disulfide isomerase
MGGNGTPVRIRHFTDPSCPFAFSAERQRLRLLWLYGDQIAWELRMIVVREHRGEGWPEAPESDATIHACRAVVGTRMRWPEREEAMLRRLQMLAAAGELLDDSDTLEIAAAQAGLPVAELAAYCAEPEVEAALRADMDLAAGRRCGEIEDAPEGLTPRRDATGPEEVLRWAGMPLTTAELAAVCGRDLDEADLSSVARSEAEHWTLA